MALFKRDYNKPGPGVPKNAPRKKGFGRLFEILGRDFGNLVKLNLLYQLCVLPAEVFLFLAVVGWAAGTGGFVLVFGLAALLLSFPVGPATTAMYYIVGKMMRDEPGFLWHDFKRVFKENFRAMLLPGMLFALVIGAQIMGVLYYLAGPAGTGVALVAAYLLSVLVFAMASPYFFVQSAYVELGVGAKLQNSVYLAIGYAPRSFMGALLGGGLVAVQFATFPASGFVMALVGYTIPCLLCMMWIWKPLDATFKIEQTLKQRQAQTLDETVKPLH